MKTTIELPDDLILRAKRRALRDSTTLKALLESGLRMVLSEKRATRAAPYEFPVIRDALKAGPDSDDINALVEDVVNKDTAIPAKWERTMRVPARFNRLLLFSPWQFHNAAPGFGQTAQSARLVMLLFFGPKA